MWYSARPARPAYTRRRWPRRRRPLERARRARAAPSLEHHLAARDRRAHGHADIEELHRHARRRERELLAVGGLESRREPPAAVGAVVIGPVGKRHDEVEALADEAA